MDKVAVDFSVAGGAVALGLIDQGTGPFFEMMEGFIPPFIFYGSAVLLSFRLFIGGSEMCNKIRKIFRRKKSE